MKLPRHISLPAVALALTLALGTTGCTTETAPSPTPTALVFETDEEAYAAAEEVYRALLETYNALDYSDTGAYGNIEPFVTGRYASAERKGLSAAYADGITKEGKSTVIWFRGVDYYSDSGEIIAITCDDIATIARFNADGTSRVHPDRPDTLARKLVFSAVGSSVRLEDAELTTDSACVL